MAGGELRFAVGRPDGPQSNIWRVWSNKGKSDVYLGPRPVLRTGKVSLHQSGDYRHATIGDDRTLLDRWTPSPEIADGWHRGYTVSVYPAALAPSAQPLPKGKVFWCEPPGLTQAVRFDIYRGAPGTSLTILGGDVAYVGEFKLVDGGCVGIIATLIETTSAERDWYERTRSQFAARVHDRTAIDIRGVAYGYDADGTRVGTDLAIPTSTPPQK
jgi:hypothetical protein